MSKVYIPNQLLQLFDQSIHILNLASSINLIFSNIPTTVQNFQTLFENFALVNMSKLVTKIDNFYLLKRTSMWTFYEARNFIFKVDWFMFIKTNPLELFENFEPS